MKKHYPIILAVLLLLCGCAGPETSQPDSTKTTAPPTTTQSVATAAYTLPVEAWYVEPAYLSYAEYFSQDRPYYGNGCDWLKFDGEKGSRYSLSACADGLAITQESTGKQYLIPDSTRFTDFAILCADGKSAYLYADDTVYRLDLRTGREEAIFRGQIIQADNIAISGNSVLHYATYENGTLKIGRLYLPDGTNDLLFEKKTDVYDFWLFEADSTLGDLTWTMIREEFVTAVKKEWADPNSPYKTGNGYDLSNKWGTAEELENVFRSPMILYGLQEALGVRALVEYTYHNVDSSVSYRIGALDSCYFGSDRMHDHYAPDTNTVPEVKTAIGSWQAGNADFSLVPGKDDPADPIGCYVYSDSTGSRYLYQVEGGIYTKLLDEPVVDAIDTGACFICWTQDGRIMAVSHDGKQTAQLYTAACGGIRDVALSAYDAKALCILDGNTIVEYDLINIRCRTLVIHDHIVSAEFLPNNENTAPDLYFFVRNGMYAGQFLLHMDTNELEEVFWL